MKIRQRGKYDYNFDIFADKFEKSIYGTIKGEWRLKLLKEDLEAVYNTPTSLDILDSGCGLGQMSLWFAQKGHNLTCCDISYKMLQKAKKKFEQNGIKASFYQTSAQELAPKLPLQDVILFHAILEWLAKPLDTLEIVASRLKVGGYLSLLFYNYNSIIFRNTLKGGWRIQTLIQNRWYGRGKRLTPPHPQKPQDIISWLQNRNYKIVAHTGIRVFHDYIEEENLKDTNIDDLMSLEYKYCREDTFRNMGRYIHILAKKMN